MVNANLKISIITICYNSQPTIKRTIESVLAQDYPNIEYIIVDGASTDGTLDIINQYQDRLTLISEPDNGYSDAINKGIARARGDWIHLLNSDDSYTSSNALRDAVVLLKPQSLNYCSIVRTWPDGRRKYLPLRYESKWPVRNRRWTFWITSSMLHPGMIISKEQYRITGIYNQQWRYSADIDMILRLLKEYALNYISITLVNVEQGGMSQKNRYETAREFACITILHGYPSLLAWLFFYLKVYVLWPILICTDRFRFCGDKI